MFTSSNGRDSKDDETNCCPDKSRDFDGPQADVLHTETHGVHVGDGDGNGRKDENKLYEFTESVDACTMALECFVHETSCTGSIKCSLPISVAGNASHESRAEPHDEDLGADQTDVGPVKQSRDRHIFFHVDGVIGREGTPGDGITQTGGAERHDIGHLGFTASHGEVLHVRGTEARKDGEEGVHDQPGVALV